MRLLKNGPNPPLRHIRIASVTKLKARILKGIAEMNAAPIVFRWKNFDLEIA